VSSLKTHLRTLWANARSALESVQLYQKQHYDLRTKPQTFREGELVLLNVEQKNLDEGKNKKLAFKFHGPYRVVRQDPGNARLYKLEPAEEGVNPRVVEALIHVNRLKPFRQLPPRFAAMRGAIVADEDEIPDEHHDPEHHEVDDRLPGSPRPGPAVEEEPVARPEDSQHSEGTARPVSEADGECRVPNEAPRFSSRRM